jgi:hypothetical protein
MKCVKIRIDKYRIFGMSFLYLRVKIWQILTIFISLWQILLNGIQGVRQDSNSI